MKTVSADVIKYTEGIGCGIFGKNLFYGRVPNSNKVTTDLWWLTPKNSYVDAHNATGEDTLTYNFELSYRSMSLEAVDNEIFRITKEIVGSHCYELDNFHTINVELHSALPRFVTDEEQRVIGTVEFGVTVYDILRPRQQ